ncbi:hypothetical protein ACETRX_22925 [Labrys portucalensis]|uniref:Uncharacterized protein n=1 Tax=Labrys neptuniae TaxID=376174 RepID=A0ABV6ZK06_9HYPH
MDFLRALAIATVITLAATTNSGAQEYRPMSVDDYRVDQKQLLGQKVDISGFVFMMSEAWLKRDQMDAITTRLDVEDLPREDRKRLLTDCQYGCAVRLWGTVSNISFVRGITVEKIEISGKWKR